MSHLAIRAVTKVWPGGARPLGGVTLEAGPGEVLTVVGPSGAGKSTLLRVIAGLETASGGEVRIDGEDVTRRAPAARGVGMVFQEPALYPHLSVRSNITFPIDLRGIGGAEREARLGEVARVVGVEHLLDRSPTHLSGGERQLVALARAIMSQPRVLLLDEPLASLDLRTRESLRSRLRGVLTRMSAASVYVTHDQEEALALGDRVAVLRGGVVCQVGRPEEVYERPGTRWVASFIGSPGMNFAPGILVPGGVVRVGDEGPGWVCGVMAAAPTPVMVGVRPVGLRLTEDAAPGALAVQIEAVTYVGGAFDVRVRLRGGEVWMVRAASRPKTLPGGAGWVAACEGQVRLFEPGEDGAAL